MPWQRAERGQVGGGEAQRRLDTDQHEHGHGPRGAARHLREDRDHDQRQGQRRDDGRPVDPVHDEPGHLREREHVPVEHGAVEHTAGVHPVAEAGDAERHGRRLDDDLGGDQVGQHAVRGSHDRCSSLASTGRRGGGRRVGEPEEPDGGGQPGEDAGDPGEDEPDDLGGRALRQQGQGEPRARAGGQGRRADHLAEPGQRPAERAPAAHPAVRREQPAGQHHRRADADRGRRLERHDAEDEQGSVDGQHAECREHGGLGDDDGAALGQERPDGHGDRDHQGTGEGTDEVVGGTEDLSRREAGGTGREEPGQQSVGGHAGDARGTREAGGVTRKRPRGHGGLGTDHGGDARERRGVADRGADADLR